MKMRDVSLFDLSTDDSPSHADLVDADRLIFDLSALVDAGLIAVHTPAFGPARYGVTPAPDEARCA